jgi:tyrosine-protein kinase
MSLRPQSLRQQWRLNVSTHDTITGPNGGGERPGRLLPPGRLDRLSEGASHVGGGDTTSTGVGAGQARRGPAASGGRSRFLLKYSWWIVLITIVALAGAKLILHSQTRVYKSQATVVVQPPGTQASANQAPDMATEKGVVASSAVLTIASHILHVPTGELFNGLSVSSPGSTYLLNVAYSSPNKYTAQQRAEAIAEAYVAYRTPKPGSDHKAKGATTPSVVTSPTATLITPASLPVSPSSPKAALEYAIALLLGLGLGIGTAAIRDRLDDRLRGPGDLAARTDAPVLAMVPAFWGTSRDPSRRLVMVSSPESAIADAYRDLRTRIVQVAAAPGTTTLVITSPAREDKDTVAANLAVALAQAGWSTALVCADLRWGRIHELFGAENTEGLVGLIDRRTDLANALIPTGISALRVLPAGSPPLDTGAVLQGSAFRSVLTGLSRWADFVIIDAPPVLASADAAPLADLADTILLVTDAHRTTRVQVEAAIGELAQFRGKFAGCVFTSAGMRRLLPRSRAPLPIADSNPTIASSGDGHSQDFSGDGGSRSANTHPAQPGHVADDGNRRGHASSQGEDDQ